MQKVLKYMYLFFTVSAKKTVFAVRTLRICPKLIGDANSLCKKLSVTRIASVLDL